VRDGRDVCVSMQMRAMRVPPWRTERDRQIELWVRSIRTGLALRADDRLRDRITVVRYEDLKANPEAEIARLYSAAGLDAPSELVTKVAAKTNIDRYPTGAGEFRHRGDVGTYVDHFSADDDRLFRAMVGDLFAEVGYSY
jgi:sulfotransferase family protein